MQFNSYTHIHTHLHAMNMSLLHIPQASTVNANSQRTWLIKWHQKQSRQCNEGKNEANANAKAKINALSGGAVNGNRIITRDTRNVKTGS